MDPSILPATTYFWLKSAHIIAVIAWMAGLFYLPRLFVYHADTTPGSDQSETFKIMERRLLSVIMGPAMVVTWAFGLLLAWTNDWWFAPWFVAKLFLVAAMTWFHFWLALRQRDFAADRNTRSAKTFRILNELPTLLVVAIVVLAVVKPF